MFAAHPGAQLDPLALYLIDQACHLYGNFVETAVRDFREHDQKISAKETKRPTKEMVTEYERSIIEMSPYNMTRVNQRTRGRSRSRNSLHQRRRRRSRPGAVDE